MAQNGWEAIRDAFNEIYAGSLENTQQFGTLIGWQLGGPDPLDSFRVYDGGDFWHIIGFGLSELFEKQSENNNKTYQFITAIQEIKLQDCEQRRRWEWEDIQADLFKIQMKSLKLQQSQEAGSIFINEIKNIVITVVAATSVIQGSLTLGMMLAIEYIIGQLNSPVEQLMNFLYSLQDVKISLSRINEIHDMENEEDVGKQLTICRNTSNSLNFDHVNFKYNKHSSRLTLDNISITIPESKVTAIVGASGSGKTTLIKLLLGYYPVMNGAIYIGKTDLCDYNLNGGVGSVA